MLTADGASEEARTYAESQEIRTKLKFRHIPVFEFHRSSRVTGELNVLLDYSIRPRQRVKRIAPCSLGAVREDWREGVMG